MKSKGLYIHIPFCKSKCPYCDFYSVRVDEKLMDSYTEAVIDEIRTGRRTSEFTDGADMSFDTVYFGGGTPSVFGDRRISRILDAVRENYSIIDNSEITVECNPSSCSDSLFDGLAHCDVNRISIGMQSYVDAERKKLGRIADSEAVGNAVKLARRHGIDNISLDIMLGIELQTQKSLDETIDFCLSLGVPHISAYMLKIEENTPFYRKRDRLVLPSEDDVCEMYLHLAERLEAAGIMQYEISNFARKGYESRHNLKYWSCEEYLGIGAAAHSFINGRRFFFERNIQSFINGEKAVFDSDGGDFGEYLMLKCRLSDGISDGECTERFGHPIPESVKKQAEILTDYGLVSYDGNSIKLTKNGFLVSNSVITRLLT